jgi:hypothetical protein
MDRPSSLRPFGPRLGALEHIGAILAHSAAMVNTAHASKRAAMSQIGAMII